MLEIFKQKMKMSPPLSDQDIERCHRLGRQTDTGRQNDPARPRCMIIRFKSETNARFSLQCPMFPKESQQVSRAGPSSLHQRGPYTEKIIDGFPNKNITCRKKIADCWTHNEHVVVKENNNLIKRINSPRDLNSY